MLDPNEFGRTETRRGRVSANENLQRNSAAHTLFQSSGRSTVKVTLLGTGAPLHPTRNTLGLLVEAPGCEPLLIDTCGGFELARALARVGYRDERLASLGNVVVTHQHGDHIGGAMALFLGVASLRFYGHEAALEGVESLLHTTFPHYGATRGHGVTYASVQPSEVYFIGGFEASFFEVVHRVPTYAVRLWTQNKVLAFSADSLPCDALVECARDADLFICDAICAAADDYARHAAALMHPVATEAADLAQRAGAKALALTHLVRYSTPEKMLEEARAIFEGSVGLPDDGDTLDV